MINFDDYANENKTKYNLKWNTNNRRFWIWNYKSIIEFKQPAKS